MNICVVTLFPELVGSFMQCGIPRKAAATGQLSVTTVNPRDFATDAHRTVDDRPFGGGPGMVMKVEPLFTALAEARRIAGEGCEETEVKTLYLSPQGQQFTQVMAREFVESRADKPASLVLLAGRYEGVDERLIENEIDAELSIGDYVLSGGEAAALVIIDCVSRLLPGVLGCADSADQDSFDQDGLLDCPHYTRPETWVCENGEIEVPEVLLSGDHQRIERWRRRQALKRTLERRPDLLQNAALTESDHQCLADLLHDRTES